MSIKSIARSAKSRPKELSETVGVYYGPAVNIAVLGLCSVFADFLPGNDGLCCITIVCCLVHCTSSGPNWWKQLTVPQCRGCAPCKQLFPTVLVELGLQFI